MLGPLSAVASPDGHYIGVFINIYPSYAGISTTGIWELPFREEETPLWKYHGYPASFQGVAPQGVAAPSGYLSIFIAGTDGNLYERHQGGLDWGKNHEPWEWINHGLGPSGAGSDVGIESIAPIVSTPNGYLGVFCISTSGHLFERFSSNGSSWSWTNRGYPPSGSGIMNHTTVASQDGSYIGVFCRDTQDVIWELPFQHGSPSTWVDHGISPNPAPGSRLSAIILPSGFVSVFLVTQEKQRLYDLSQKDWSWIDHGNPGGMRQISSSPIPVMSPDKKYSGVFVIDTMHKVWELPFRNGWESWISHDHPFTGAYYDPSPVATPDKYVGVFVCGANKHLYEMYQIIDEEETTREGWSRWFDHGSPFPE